MLIIASIYIDEIGSSNTIEIEYIYIYIYDDKITKNNKLT